MSQPGQAPSKDTRAMALAGTLPASWRVALPTLVLVLALILLLYRDAATAMVGIWYRSETFAHGFVVPPIVLWLVWRRREVLARMVPGPSLPVLIPVAGAAVLWLLGDLVAVNSVTQLALVALLVLSVPAVLGLQVARAITFPLAFTFFAVPIGEFLLPQLMEWTANFTIIALRISGIPVYREGLQFVIPSGSWSVVEACSGVRYLIASLTVGTLFAYLNYQSTRRRLLFVLVSILVPIVANWLRAYMIVMLGHLSGNTLAVGVDHLVYGWVFFGVVIVLMFIIGARWSEPEPVFDAQGRSPPAAPTTASSRRLMLAAAGLAIIAGLPPMAKWLLERDLASAARSTLVAPVELADGWRASGAAATGFKPAFDNTSAEISQEYDKAGKRVGLYLGYYRNQNYSRKLVSSNNVLVTSTDKVWSRVASQARSVQFGQSRASVRTSELRRIPLAGPDQSERLLAWQIYWINGTLTANDYLAKVYSAMFRLTGRGDDSALIVVYAAKEPAGGESATLESFLAANYGVIDAMLRQAGGSK